MIPGPSVGKFLFSLGLQVELQSEQKLYLQAIICRDSFVVKILTGLSEINPGFQQY